MNNRFNSFNPDLAGIGPALKQISIIADQLQKSNQNCLIPCRGTGERHDDINNCHVIAEGYLDMISNANGQVYCWPTSARVLADRAVEAIRAKRLRPQPPYFDIQEYHPIKSGKNQRYVKHTFACHYHDTKVFALVDTVANFNPYDPETQFLLGLRTIAAYAAFYQGHKRFAQHDFDKDPKTRIILARFPQARPLAEKIREFGTSKGSVLPELTATINLWRAIYVANGMNRVASHTTTATTKIRIAATSFFHSRGNKVAVTILPSKEKETESTIIATAISHQIPPHNLTRGIHPEIAHAQAEQVKNRLQSEQTAALTWLVQNCEFLYVSPDDYDNNDFISDEERTFIARSAATKIYTGMDKKPQHSAQRRTIYHI